MDAWTDADGRSVALSVAVGRWVGRRPHRIIADEGNFPSYLALALGSGLGAKGAPRTAG